MLRIGFAALVAAVVPISEVKQPPEAPPCDHADMSCVTPTLYIEAADQIAAYQINLPPRPKRAWMGEGSPRAPQAVVLIVCRTDDLTGQPGRHQPEMAARGWRDLEPHVENGEVQCEHVEVPLEDATQYHAAAPSDLIPLTPNFGNPMVCARAGIMFASTYKERPGWDVLAIGCPTPITDETGKVIDWKMPECPRQLAQMRGFTCNFTKREV